MKHYQDKRLMREKMPKDIKEIIIRFILCNEVIYLKRIPAVKEFQDE